jgi:signal transduction histidine kinase
LRSTMPFYFDSHLIAIILFFSLPALATLIYVSYRWRLRQLVREMEALLQERLAERERIARSLHDTLLQGVQGAILFLQMAVDKVPPELPARGALDRALSYIEDALVEGRDQVMGLRASICGNGGLADALSRVGQRMAGGFSTEFRTAVSGEPYHISSRVCDDLFAIAREAIINAFRHAQAVAVELELVYGEEHFSILVRDDGIGIGPDLLRAGGKRDHWGLVGMRERADLIGARLDFSPGAEAGTVVRLMLPADLAQR